MTEKIFLKDTLFSKEKVSNFISLIKGAYPKLDETSFKNELLISLDNLELKERMYALRKGIEKYVPENYITTLKILESAVKGEEQNILFLYAVLPDYVEINGCNKKYLDISLKYLAIFTKYCSSEFAIRDFINNFPDETYTISQTWLKSENQHIRRFVSEGWRPKLPWGKAINTDYKTGAKLLDSLYYDTERYVTRSVANHLNDISKIDPDFVVQTLERRKKSKKQNEKEMGYIISHSLRTSVKKGHEKSLIFLGYNSNPKINVSDIKIKNKNIILGKYLEFSFKISTKNYENLMVDYKIIYSNPTDRYSEKIFKLSSLSLNKNSTKIYIKKHMFKNMTTKKLYSGTHKIQLQINGKIFSETCFELLV